MKKIFSLTQIVLIVGCIMVYSSCSEDFLKKEPPAVLSLSSMETERGVEGMLIGTYACLRSGWDVFGSSMGTDWVYASIASDDCYKGSDPGDAINCALVERFEVLPSNAYMEMRWKACYNGVARSNETLVVLKVVQAGSSPLSAERATQIEAESKYLRAWFHFSANRIFKNIPYVRTPDEQGGKQPDEIPNPDPGWSGIEADLNFAIEHLPESWPSSDVGRPTKFAAMTLKAQAYMYQNKLSEAKPLLDGVLNSGKYELVENYFDNYNEDTENNEESIFEIQCATETSAHTSMLVTRPSAHQVGPFNLGWGFYQPTNDLVNCYQVDNNGLPYLDVNTRPQIKSDMGVTAVTPFTPTDQVVDLRLDWTVSRRGIPFLDWGVAPGASWIRQQANGGPYMTKKYHHFRKNHDSQFPQGRFNHRNFRYHRLAHVILWRAEIAVEENELSLARELVNRIRNRAKISDPVMGFVSADVIPVSGVVDPSQVDWTKPAANYKVEPYPEGHVAFSSQSNARDAVRMEIRLEFATEGQRFFDLRRWGIDIVTLNDYIRRDLDFRSYLTGVTYSEKNRYWPIPQSQIDLQMGVLIQDPAYM